MTPLPPFPLLWQFGIVKKEKRIVRLGDNSQWNHLILLGGQYSLVSPLRIHLCIYLCKHIKQSCLLCCFGFSCDIVTLRT